MKKDVLQYSLQYAEMGLSVIPCKPADKKPYIEWKEYQTHRASKDEIEAWWESWPNAMVGIVTGKISGVLVLDCDTLEGYDAIQKLIPDSLMIPIASTPRGGWHLYFQHSRSSGLTTKVAVIPGVDIRSDGGYIIAPPSINGTDKGYKWQEGLSIFEVEPPSVPQSLIKYINIYMQSKEHIKNEAESLQFLTQGTRDNDLFNIANSLIKGGCKENTARQVLNVLANNCNPPFSEKDAQIKIDSALSRCKHRERNLTEDLHRWIDLTSGYFFLKEAYEPLQILTSQKNTVHQIMHRFVKDGYVERHPNKNGIYRRIDREIEFMDFANADTENIVDLHLPLDLQTKTRIFPKSAIVIAGVSGKGKTLFALNTIAENMARFPIYYFNSEMGPEALKHKLSHFPIPIEEWAKHMKVVDNWDFNNIADKIQSDAFNVIDYLEPEGEKAFNIHGVISAIIRRLNKGTALITIQKKPDIKLGTGGIYSIKAATLALALEWGEIEIVKNRFREVDPTPSLNKINFEVHQGYKFDKKGGWYRG